MGDVEREPAGGLGEDPGRTAQRRRVRRSGSVMLSSRTRSAPAATTSRTCSTVSHSTSTARSGNRARTAAKAAATPPAATTWLSLTSAASDSAMRWFWPPPARTAYFSRARRPGVVLRVSRTRTPVPSTASTQRRVSVATPDRWQSRLSALRSAVSRARTGPRATRTASPTAARRPSDVGSSARPPTTSSTAIATGIPATTPAARGTNAATPRRSAGTVATEVTSTPPARSSASVRRASSSTAATSRPAAVSACAVTVDRLMRAPARGAARRRCR